MAQQTEAKPVAPHRKTARPGDGKSTKQAKSEETVTFTSFDGTTREVGDLPENLARATALASEKTLSKIWGTAEEEAACQNMRKEI